MCGCNKKSRAKRAPASQNNAATIESDLVPLGLREHIPVPLALNDVEVNGVSRDYVVVKSGEQRYKEHAPIIGHQGLVKQEVREAMLNRWPHLFEETGELDKLFKGEEAQQLATVS
jgi:hypothetical protein